MAITITYSPYEISSAHRQMRFVAQSNATADDLKLRVKVEYSRDGVNFTPLGELYGNQLNNTNNTNNVNEFEFDVSNRLQSVLSHDYFEVNQSELIADTPNSIVVYKLTFTEQYANAIGLQEDFDILTTNLFYACNAIYLRSEPQNLQQFIIEPLTGGATSSDIPFLTAAPLTMDIQKGEWIQLSFLSNLTTSLTGKVKVITQSGIAIHSLPPIAPILRRGTLIFHVDDYYTSDLKGFDLWLENEDGQRVTEIRTFIFRTLKGRSYYRLCWLNHKGGFDFYTFLGADRETVDYEKTTTHNYLPYDFTPAHASKKIFSSEAQTTIVVSSLWASLETRRWLADLFASLQVWLIDDNSQRVAITVLNTSYLVKEDKRLLQVPVEFEFVREKII